MGGGRGSKGSITVKDIIVKALPRHKYLLKIFDLERICKLMYLILYFSGRDLSSNQLKSLPPGLFNHCAKLEDL